MVANILIQSPPMCKKSRQGSIIMKSAVEVQHEREAIASERFQVVELVTVATIYPSDSDHNNFPSI